MLNVKYIDLSFGFWILFVICNLSFVIFFSKIAYCKEPAGPIEVNGDHVEYLPSEKKVIGKGNISIDYEDARLTCDSIIVYTETKEIEAEGNAVLKNPVAELRGERIGYSFITKQGEILKPRVKSGEWYSGGDALEITAENSYVVRNGYITSCNLDPPHYKISAKKIIISPDNKVTAKNVIIKAGNMPLMYMPQYDYSFNADWPVFNVIPGKKNRWGVFALTDYRYELNDYNKLTLRIDERENWGLAEGVDYKYGLGSLGHGLLRTYYTYQRDMDRNEITKAEGERYRVQLRHRMDVDEHTMLFLEYNRLSDGNFTKDYFYREEYDRVSSPETYGYLLDKEAEYSISGLVRKRVNRFQSVVERLPEVRFDLKDQKLFDLPVYFKTDTVFTNLNSKTGNSSSDSDVMRVDVFNRLTLPLRTGSFLNAAPFVGMRDTVYSKDINGDEGTFRTAFYTGVDMSAKFFKTYDARGKFMGIDLDQLHHVVTPNIEYEYIHEPSLNPDVLQQFDDVDNVAGKNTFTLGLENKLQTKRLIDNKQATVDLGALLLTGDYLYGSRLSNVKADLELTPLDWLRIESDTQYDPSTRDFQDWNADVYMDHDDWRVGFGSRYWQDTEHELTSELFFKLNNEWSFRLFGRYDLKEVESNGHKIINRFQTKEVSIIKDLHCWVSELSFDVDRDGGATVWFSMKLKASPKSPFDFNDYYAVPKAGKQ